MSKTLSLPGLVAVTFVMAGCDPGLLPFTSDPNTVIASGYDTGVDRGALVEGDAAIAYDPDGCQAWIVDDGFEGYSGRRFDPVTGLPVCDNLFPPGSVVGNYQAQHSGMSDLVPGPRINP